MITIAEYAATRGVSRQAVEKTIARYADELEPHMHKQGRVKYLDDEAAEILDQHRAPRPLIIGAAAEALELDRLRAENDRMRDKLIEAQSLIIALQSKVLEGTQAAAALPGVEAERDRLRNEADRLREELGAEKEARREAEAKAEEREKRPWWSRLFSR